MNENHKGNGAHTLRSRVNLFAATAPLLLAVALSPMALAQNASGPLPPVVVQPDQGARPPQPGRAGTRATKRRAARPARTAAKPVPAPAPAPTATSATARDGVEGYVARTTGIGTKSATPLLELPRSVSTVTGQEIRDRNAQTIQEALQYMAGVDVYFRPGNLTREITLIRGFQAFQYLDGLKLHDSNWGFEPYGVERIDVLKGPASFLYGQGSAGGLWAMTSKRPTEDPFAEVLLRFGLHKQMEGAFDVGGPVTPDRSVLYRVVGVGKFGNGEIDFTKNERTYFAPSMTFRPNLDTSITILASYQYDPHLTVLQPLPYVGTVQPGPNGQYVSRNLFLGEPNYHDTNIESHRIGYAFEHRFNDIFSFEQNARYERININLNEVLSRSTMVGNSNIVRQMQSQVYDLDVYQIDNRAKFDFAVGPFRNHLVLGADAFALPNFQGTGVNRASQYLLNLYNPVYGQALAFNPITSYRWQNQTQYGWYVEDRIQVGPWTVLAGGRIDNAELNQNTRVISAVTGLFGPPAPVNQIDHSQTYNVGVIYKFDSGIAPYVSHATSFYPQIGAEFSGKAFAPLTGEQSEAGIRYLPPGYNVMMAAAVFDITQNNVLTGDAANPGFQKPLGSIRSRGAEFEVKTTNLYGFNIIGSYTHLEPTMIASPVASAVGKTPAGIAVNQASLWTTYRFSYGVLDGLTLGGGVRYVGESWGDPLNTLVVPSFTLLDLTARYELGAVSPMMKNWNVALNVKNVFDKTYVSSCEDGQNCYYGPGRAIDVTLRGRW